jgi:MFS family permease
MSMRQRLTLALICVATFMLLLDITVVTVSLPDTGRDLRADLAALQWVLDAYTLLLAAMLLLSVTVSELV